MGALAMLLYSLLSGDESMRGGATDDADGLCDGLQQATTIGHDVLSRYERQHANGPPGVEVKLAGARNRSVETTTSRPTASSILLSAYTEPFEQETN